METLRPFIPWITSEETSMSYAVRQVLAIVVALAFVAAVGPTLF